MIKLEPLRCEWLRGFATRSRGHTHGGPLSNQWVLWPKILPLQLAVTFATSGGKEVTVSCQPDRKPFV